MAHRVLANVVLVLHWGFLGYVIVGGFVAWRWPRAIVAHVAAAGWALLIVLHEVDCPLTAAQNWARDRGGQPPLLGGFVEGYIEGVLYPARFTGLVQFVVALILGASWLVTLVRWNRRRRADRHPWPITRSDTGGKDRDSAHRAATV